MDAAVRHPVERPPRHRRSVLAARARGAREQRGQEARGRELRRAAEAAVDGVVLGAQRLERAVEQRGVRRGARLAPRARAQGLDDLARGALHGVPPLPPGRRDGLEHLHEGRHPRPRRRREVGAGVERAAVGRQEDRHRPAALAGGRDHGLHVERVDVGALLAVDLDAHEVLVHVAGRDDVLERLALHHVAPVAGGVADAEQDRPVEGAGARERLRPPREPVDGVPRVLEQVRGGLRGEAVRRRPQVAHGARSVRRPARVRAARVVPCAAWPTCRRRCTRCSSRATAASTGWPCATTSPCRRPGRASCSCACTRRA